MILLAVSTVQVQRVELRAAMVGAFVFATDEQVLLNLNVSAWEMRNLRTRLVLQQQEAIVRVVSRYMEYAFWVRRQPPEVPKLQGVAARVMSWEGVEASWKQLKARLSSQTMALGQTELTVDIWICRTLLEVWKARGAVVCILRVRQYHWLAGMALTVLRSVSQNCMQQLEESMVSVSTRVQYIVGRTWLQLSISWQVISMPRGEDSPSVAGKAGMSQLWKGKGRATSRQSEGVIALLSMKEKESWVMLPALAQSTCTSPPRILPAWAVRTSTSRSSRLFIVIIKYFHQRAYHELMGKNYVFNKRISAFFPLTFCNTELGLISILHFLSRKKSPNIFQNKFVVKYMRTDADMIKTVDLLEYNNKEGKTVLGARNIKAAIYAGKSISRNHYYIFELRKSEGTKKDNISNDILYQQMKKVFVKDTGLTTEEVAKKAHQRLKQFYPDRNCNIFVWLTGEICHSKGSNFEAYAQFQPSKDKQLGYDVLIIIK